jgi:hypothetical protein
MMRWVCRNAACWFACVGGLAAGCSHTVVPPASPTDPVSAFLLDHGQHASLVLERDTGLTRYTYGHWGYYAEGRTGSVQASGALLGAGEAGLGRRSVPGPPELANVEREVLVRVEAAWEIEVARERARALGVRFDRLFAASAAHTYNARYDLDFVRHPQPYHLGHNSNHIAAQWLSTLGCRVRLNGVLSVWSLRPPRDAASGAGDKQPADDAGVPASQARSRPVAGSHGR